MKGTDTFGLLLKLMGSDKLWTRNFMAGSVVFNLKYKSSTM